MYSNKTRVKTKKDGDMRSGKQFPAESVKGRLRIKAVEKKGGFATELGR